ncbi:GFA family protein [Ramlibacter tataouinensis]|uniref:CENP-V/GFA domain-containing protein n=1 Tax=Ramlibacter tataouinensis (strain ATCC BAA-407 / DSM 14655 / LMG 21543 / TTB310) TaxID=365046 RepID=F5XXL9_RAMTT|nr:GFA family protein [Ramlibacter tataouinensis]AEG91822.1 Conserved hypothetical protein [Ramlibacter tataouinensis TTB310]
MTAAFHGSCHCAAVRFRCELEVQQPTSRCNCSICRKSRFWKTLVAGDRFTLLQGRQALAEYRFGSRRIAHMFCRHCGVKVYGHSGAEAFGQEFYAVNLACLDDVRDEDLAALPLAYEDGRHDDWASAPAVTCIL